MEQCITQAVFGEPLSSLYIPLKIVGNEKFPFTGISETGYSQVALVWNEAERLFVEKTEKYPVHAEHSLKISYVHMEKDKNGGARLYIPSGLKDEEDFPFEIPGNVLLSLDGEKERLILEKYKGGN